MNEDLVIRRLPISKQVSELKGKGHMVIYLYRKALRKFLFLQRCLTVYTYSNFFFFFFQHDHEVEYS